VCLLLLKLLWVLLCIRLSPLCLQHLSVIYLINLIRSDRETREKRARFHSANLSKFQVETLLSLPLFNMSSPAPEGQEARPEDAMQQDEPQEDRYDVTGPEGGDGQPEVRGDQSQPVNNKGPALMDIVCYSSLLSSVALY